MGVKNQGKNVVSMFELLSMVLQSMKPRKQVVIEDAPVCICKKMHLSVSVAVNGLLYQIVFLCIASICIL